MILFCVDLLFILILHVLMKKKKRNDEKLSPSAKKLFVCVLSDKNDQSM